jgi:lysozyme
MGDVCDEPLASKWLVEDTAMAEEAVNRLVKTKLSQGQYDAVCSFVFNVGPDYFKESTLLRRLNEGRFKEAGSEFERWIYGGGKVLGGLVRRRKAERLMFEGTK